MTEPGWAEFWDRVRRFDTHPPLYYSLLKLWQCLAPATPLGLRSLSVLAGLAMLPLAWLCARELAPRPWAGAFAVAAAAVASPLVIAARQARPYALFALAFALALWAALRLRLWLPVAAAVAAAILLRGWDLAGRPLWLDESWSRWMTEPGWAEFWDRVRRFDTHPPLYYSLLRLWHGFTPATPLGLRALSLLAGLAMLPLAWLCARRVAPDRNWPAPLIIAAMALSPPLVIASRQARPYALFALAFALALWAALALLRSGRPRAALWLAYLAGLELVLWLHGLGVLFAAALGAGLMLALALQRRLREQIVPFLLVHALAVLAWLPCLSIIVEQRRAWTQTWLRFAWSDVPSGLAAGLAAPGAAALPIFLLAALGAATLYRREEDRPVAAVLILAALAPAAATILLSAVSAPVFLPRTLVPSVLPLLLLAGAGVARLARPPARAAAAALMVLLLAAASIMEIRRPPEEQWTRLSGWLAERVGPGEEVWLLPNELILPLRYGGGELRYPVRGIPAEFPAPDHPAPRYTGTIAVPGMGEGDAAHLVADARRRGVDGIWVVSRFPRWFDPGGSLARAFPAPPVERSIGFAPLLVEHYRLASIPPPG